MFYTPTVFLYAVIAALTVIVAIQAAASVRAQRKQKATDLKVGIAIAQTISILLKSSFAAVKKAHREGYAQAISDLTEPLLRRRDTDFMNALLFGPPSPTGRFATTIRPFNSLTGTDPVERTAANQVAGDGGMATEAEANAESQATPLPADYALRGGDRSDDKGQLVKKAILGLGYATHEEDFTDHKIG